MIVNPITPATDEQRYELFEETATTDTAGNPVTIFTSMGKYSVTQLTNQINFLASQLADAQAKLDAINNPVNLMSTVISNNQASLKA